MPHKIDVKKPTTCTSSHDTRRNTPVPSQEDQGATSGRSDADTPSPGTLTQQMSSVKETNTDGMSIVSKPYDIHSSKDRRDNVFQSWKEMLKV